MQRITGNEEVENTMSVTNNNCPGKEEAEQKKVFLQHKKWVQSQIVQEKKSDILEQKYGKLTCPMN